MEGKKKAYNTRLLYNYVTGGFINFFLSSLLYCTLFMIQIIDRFRITFLLLYLRSVRAYQNT